MYKDSIKTILEHFSVKKYNNGKVSPEHEEILFQVAQSIPNSMHAQSCSLIVVRDKEKRKKLAELCGNQPQVEEAGLFLVLVADFYRIHEMSAFLGKEEIIHQSAEGLLVGTVDTSIMLQSLVIAAESMGYGTVPIGGIRRDPEAVIELLELPRYTFPIVGLCIGIPAEKPSKKPRLPREAVIFEDTYKKGVQVSACQELDGQSKEYTKNMGGESRDWSTRVTDIFATIYYPKVYEVLKKQGFSIDK